MNCRFLNVTRIWLDLEDPLGVILFRQNTLIKQKIVMTCIEETRKFVDYPMTHDALYTSAILLLKLKKK